MEAAEIAEIFELTAQLLELQGENPFKVRAFLNAAASLRAFPGTLQDFISKLQSESIKGFGKQLSQHVSTLYNTGELPYLYQLQAAVPESLLELLDISGLGVKKVRAIYQQLGITNLSQLKEACQRDEIASLAGFGQKTQQRILEEIDFKLMHEGMLLANAAEDLAAKISSLLNSIPGTRRLSSAGSLRRKCELVDKLIFVMVCDSPSSIPAALSKQPEIRELNALSPHLFSAVWLNGTPLEVIAVEERSFAAALISQTGNSAHLTALHKHALEQGAAFDLNTVCAGSEEEIYNWLGLAFIPPEAREGTSEMELAHEAFTRGKSFPPLLELHDIKGIIHAHTTYSDGVNTLEDMALGVRRLGYQYLGLTDHSQNAAYAGGLSPQQLKRQHAEIDELNKKLAPFMIFKGIESEIRLDGALDYPPSILKELDFVLGSVHTALRLNAPQMTRRICTALTNPHITILGHPSGRLLLRRRACEIDMSEILKTASEQSVAIEINANPRRLDLDWRFHQQAKALGINLPLCADAHFLDALNDLGCGINIARKGLLQPTDMLTCLDVKEIAEFFHKRKARIK